MTNSKNTTVSDFELGMELEVMNYGASMKGTLLATRDRDGNTISHLIAIKGPENQSDHQGMWPISSKLFFGDIVSYHGHPDGWPQQGYTHAYWVSANDPAKNTKPAPKNEENELSKPICEFGLGEVVDTEDYAKATIIGKYSSGATLIGYREAQPIKLLTSTAHTSTYNAKYLLPKEKLNKEFPVSYWVERTVRAKKTPSTIDPVDLAKHIKEITQIVKTTMDKVMAEPIAKNTKSTIKSFKLGDKVDLHTLFMNGATIIAKGEDDALLGFTDPTTQFTGSFSLSDTQYAGLIGSDQIISGLSKTELIKTYPKSFWVSNSAIATAHDTSEDTTETITMTDKIIKVEREGYYYFTKESDHKAGRTVYHNDNDQPALVYANGTQVWYRNGRCHRDNDQPAVIHPDGRKEYWVNSFSVDPPATPDKKARKAKDPSKDLSIGDILKEDATNAMYRVVANQLTKGIKSSIIAMMQAQGSQHIRAISEMLDTEYGASLISFILGMLLEYTPFSKDQRIERIAEEFRIEGISKAGNAAFDDIIKNLLPVISKTIIDLSDDAVVLNEEIEEEIVIEQEKQVSQC